MNKLCSSSVQVFWLQDWSGSFWNRRRLRQCAMAHSENITMQRPSREFFENNKGATRCEWGPNTKTKCKIIQMIVAEVAVQRRGCYWMIGSATIVKFLPNIFIFAVVLRTKRQFVLPLWANPNHIAKYYLLIGQGQASSRITQLLLVVTIPKMASCTRT